MTVYDESFCLKKSDESKREVEYIIMIAIVFEVMIKIVLYGKSASSLSLQFKSLRIKDRPFTGPLFEKPCFKMGSFEGRLQLPLCYNTQLHSAMKHFNQF